jgi:hypothetical protein
MKASRPPQWAASFISNQAACAPDRAAFGHADRHRAEGSAGEWRGPTAPLLLCRAPNRHNGISTVTSMSARAVVVQRGVGFRPASGAIVIHFAVSGPIERPVCKQCGTRATLARVSPGNAGCETHSFECSSCHHVFIRRVAAHPISACKG